MVFGHILRVQMKFEANDALVDPEEHRFNQQGAELSGGKLPIDLLSSSLAYDARVLVLVNRLRWRSCSTARDSGSGSSTEEQAAKRARWAEWADD